MVMSREDTAAQLHRMVDAWLKTPPLMDPDGDTFHMVLRITFHKRDGTDSMVLLVGTEPMFEDDRPWLREGEERE